MKEKKPYIPPKRKHLQPLVSGYGATSAPILSNTAYGVGGLTGIFNSNQIGNAIPPSDAGVGDSGTNTAY